LYNAGGKKEGIEHGFSLIHTDSERKPMQDLPPKMQTL
jgi:hypothetical protein